MKIDTKILKFLYSKKNDGLSYDVSMRFPDRFQKDDIDNYVIEMEENGFVIKKVKGKISESAIPPGEDLSDANNSMCKISHEGIVYYENFIKNKNTRLLSKIALIVSLIAVLFTALTYFKK